MNRTAVVVLLVGVVGCVTPNPRGVMVSRTPTGGEIALYDAADGEASQKAALEDAGRQMAEACAPRGWTITGMGLYDTKTWGHYERDSSGDRGPTIKVKKLDFQCREAPPKGAEAPATQAVPAAPGEAPAEPKGM
jgi:hypothetical protein